jgi:hypothetical protein
MPARNHLRQSASEARVKLEARRKRCLARTEEEATTFLARMEVMYENYGGKSTKCCSRI